MSAIGAIGGAVAGIAQSAVPSIISAVSNRYLQKKQHSAAKGAAAQQQIYNQINYRNRYQWMAEDMRKAGLNPILAASGGFNVSGSPQAGLPNMASASINAPPMDIAGSVKELQQAKTEEDKQDLIKNQSKHEIAKIFETRERTKKVTTEERVLMQEHFKLEKEFSLIEANIKNVESITQLNYQDLERLQTLITQMKYNLEHLKKTSDVYAGPAGQFISYLNAILGKINVGILF
jgi:hypothetical protein